MMVPLFQKLDAHASTMRYLYPEEHVPNLINHLWIACRFPTLNALEGGKNELRGVFEVENGLRAFKIVGWLVGILAVFHLHAPLPAVLAVNFDAISDVQSLS